MPDAIILDLMMPGVTGIDVVRQLREHPEASAIPILIYTALDITDEIRNQLNDTVQAIASKSGPLDLLRELESTLMKRAA